MSRWQNSGSYWKYYKDMVELIGRLGPERATLTFYETLQTDFDAEVARLADFLGTSPAIAGIVEPQHGSAARQARVPQTEIQC